MTVSSTMLVLNKAVLRSMPVPTIVLLFQVLSPSSTRLLTRPSAYPLFCSSTLIRAPCHPVSCSTFSSVLPAAWPFSRAAENSQSQRLAIDAAAQPLRSRSAFQPLSPSVAQLFRPFVPFPPSFRFLCTAFDATKKCLSRQRHTTHPSSRPAVLLVWPDLLTSQRLCRLAGSNETPHLAHLALHSFASIQSSL